jgi:DNA-binding MarR family transcriptional regulator
MAKGTPDKAKVAALERSPSQLLHRGLQLALDLYAVEFGRGAITQRQYAVLAAAQAHDGATQTDLVRITGIDRSTLADMVARMLGKGLLERERSVVDARANAVRLTDQGREILTEAAPRMAAVDARLMKLLSGGRRRDAFLDLLKDLVRGGETHRAPAEPKRAKVKKPAKPPKAGGKKHKKSKKAEKPEAVEV